MGTTERGIAGYAEPREISFISTVIRTRIIRTPSFLELSSFSLIKISNEIYPEKSSLPPPFERLPRTQATFYSRLKFIEPCIFLFFAPLTFPIYISGFNPNHRFNPLYLLSFPQTLQSRLFEVQRTANEYAAERRIYGRPDLQKHTK